jgi:probable addiction module antidote protein
MMKIQKILREIITKEGLTLYRVSRDLGIDYASLYRSLQDKGNPKWSTIEKILKYLGYEIQAVKSNGKRMRKP